MKTLKKTLCLVLAMVMVFGLCAVSASAKLEYTDNDKINYAEAVDVMSGIGILQGDERGFRPTDNITRAEAAKIIAYIMVGNSTQADALKATANPFNDVPVGHWASGYIAYCATSGIIGGMGDGSYKPGDNVTGLQFAKMLLCALGYGVNDEYTGADWAINVSRDALRLGVFDSNLAGANNNPATREECALYAFNVIHGTEEYDGIQKVTYSALVGNYVTDNAFAGGGVVDPNKHTIFGNDFDLHLSEDDPDAFGRPQGHHWYVDKTTNIITAVYGSNKDEIGDVEDLQASYTAGVTGADIYNLLGDTFIKGLKGDIGDVKGISTLYVDGVKSTIPNSDDATGKVINLSNFTKGNTKTLNSTGNGVQVNVYAWTSSGRMLHDAISGEDYWVNTGTTNHLVITVVNTYMAKVTDVKAGTASKDPVTKVTVLKTVDPDSAFADKILLADAKLDGKGFNTEEFKEKDYVLITAASVDGTSGNGKYAIQSMVAPTVVKDTVSRYVKEDSKITVTSGGTEYVAAKNTAYDGTDIYAADDTRSVNRTLVNGKDHTLYVDEYGYLVAAADVVVDSEYVYVAQFGQKTNTSDDLTDGYDLVADIYYADGTHKITVINTKKDKDNADIAAPDPAKNSFGGDKYSSGTVTNKGIGIGVYELTMVGGKAVLTRPTAKYVDGLITSANESALQALNVTKGVSTIASASVTEKANNKTVFFYVHEGNGYGKDDYSVTVYNGINAVPVSKANGIELKAGQTVGSAGEGDKIPEAILAAYIKGGSPTEVIKAAEVKSNDDGESNDTVYFYNGVSYGVEKAADNTYDVTYVVYVDGEKEELTLNYKDYDTANTAYTTADVGVPYFFTVKENDKHEFVKVGAGTSNTDAIAKSKYDKNLVVNANQFDATTINEAYSYSADEVKFVDLRPSSQVASNDDRYTSIEAVQRDFTATVSGATNITGVTIAVKYADNASKQITVIYLLAGINGTV